VLINNDGKAVLADFGLSKTASTISQMSASKTGFQGGTAAYTAPEVLNEEDFTAKSDVYSFGIVVWEVLSGAYPVTTAGAPAGTDATSIPWNGLNHVKISNRVTRGLRPELLPASKQESNVTDAAALAKGMEKCWSDAATERPTFEQMVRALEASTSRTDLLASSMRRVVL
jgi:serine/threonine protein kinase